MKKFGTPILAAPGSASEYVGSFSAGGWAGSASSTGAGVAASSTLPVSDSVLTSSPPALLAVFVDLLLGLLLRLLRLGLRLARSGLRARGLRGGGGRRGLGRRRLDGDRRRHRRRGRRRRLGRAEVHDRGDRRGQARDLHLIDRRAGGNLDRDRQLLARDQCHAHVMHLGLRGGHEHARVEGGGGEGDGERATRGHEPPGEHATGAALRMGGHSEAWTPRTCWQASVDIG